jgi:hypothetical protein
MCAIAFRAVVGNDFEKDLTLVDFLLAKKNLQRADAASATLKAAESELSRLRTEIERYERKYADADFVVTKKQLLFLALLALFVTVLGTIAGVYGLNYALRTPISTTPLIKQESPWPALEAHPQQQIPPTKQDDQLPLKQPPSKQDKGKQPSTPPEKPTRESQK